MTWPLMTEYVCMYNTIRLYNNLLLIFRKILTCSLIDESWPTQISFPGLIHVYHHYMVLNLVPICRRYMAGILPIQRKTLYSYQSCPNMALYTSPNSREGNATSTKRGLRECHQIYCLKVTILLVTGYKHRDVNQNTHRLKTD